ncbi:hypothetical protein C8Q75DRAFT_766930 [Abortiporus biennis]|nr:hypothetical protein C8Q75DRAFT_766930 [Abortiporus biennis]
MLSVAANTRRSRRLRGSAPRIIPIPHDILNLIFAFLPDDLFNCAAVCSAWNAVAQPYLFRSIIIRSNPRLADGRRFPALNFIQFLRSSPHLANHIQSLCICSHRDQDYHGYYIRVDDMARMLSHLPNLHKLRILDIDFTKGSFPPQYFDRKQVMDHNPPYFNLKELSILHAYRAAFDRLAIATMCRFFSIFGDVDEFSLSMECHERELVMPDRLGDIVVKEELGNLSLRLRIKQLILIHVPPFIYTVIHRQMEH